METNVLIILLGSSMVLLWAPRMLELIIYSRLLHVFLDNFRYCADLTSCHVKFHLQVITSLDEGEGQTSAA